VKYFEIANCGKPKNAIGNLEEPTNLKMETQKQVR
jgi:hypothetical protein